MASSGLSQNLLTFIEAQHLFFVATAGREGSVNVSPKGLDSLRVISPTRIVWLSLSGSGNETAAHVLDTGRMTLMFSAFERPARILRVYGTARVVHPRNAAWTELLQLFPEMAGTRQIFDLAIESVSLSCGSGVPLMDFKAERGPTEMLPFYADMPPGGLEAYWARKNRWSIDGKPTGIFETHEDRPQDEDTEHR